ncbi:MAG: BlaI/MecI/CopY family transcriptional regulator [Planctomycetaceae bacterium]|nr:BlaI/MecI/CopY family transcriptional regulator [Planctomycetaceae bacterium]
MSPRQKKSLKLAPGEFELLELFWNHGAMTIAQTHEKLLARGRTLAYPTVQTRLNRLVEKKIIRKTGYYPAVYDAAVAQADVSGAYYDQLESFCGGNNAPLMLHLADKRDFQPSEIDALKIIIERYEKEQES